jgi:asparagine synthase (glutamine-hydrolysing)
VGVSLSGGLDSTSIISVMASHRAAAESLAPGASLEAFSFMSDDFDEEPYIRQTLEQTKAELRRVETDSRRLWDDLGRLLWFQDEPVHSAPALVSFQVYALAAANGVKVILCGQGADETIAGYPSYFAEYWLGLLRRGKLPRLVREIDAFARVHRRSRAELLQATLRQYCGVQLRRNKVYTRLKKLRRSPSTPGNGWFTLEVDEAFRATADESHGGLDAALRQSVEGAPLPLYLRLEDRNSMAHSVEARLPFMDYRLVSLAFHLDPEWKLRGPWNKYVLREAMQGCIPESVRTRIDKMGFPVPAGNWFRTTLYEPLQDLLASESTRARGLYNVDVIRRDFERHREGQIDIANGLFNIAQLETWLAFAGKDVAGCRSELPADDAASTRHAMVAGLS